MVFKKIRIPLIYKRIGNYLGALLLAACCLLGSFLMFLTSDSELSQIDKHSGKVIEKRIVSKNNSFAGRGSFKSDVFLIKIDGLNQVLATYNSSYDYSFFEENIKVGDNLKVYFQKSNDTIKPNLNVFQIEKSGIVLLKNEDLQNRNRIGGCVAFFGEFLLIGMAIYHDKKYWK